MPSADVNTPLTALQPQPPTYASTSDPLFHVNQRKEVATTTSTTSMKTAPSSAVRKNPFRYESPIDLYEKVKIVLMCLLGVPLLRVSFVAVILFICVVVSNIALLGFTRLDKTTGLKRVIPAWRQWLAAPVPYLVRVGLFVLGYYWIPIKTPAGFDRKKGMQRIVVCNHISFIDGLFLLSYLAPSIAMKADVADIPLIGKVVQTTQPILIDRTTPEGRKHALHEIAEHIAAPDFPPLLIFPEGTTSNQDYLTKFKVGSFTSGVPCQPLVIKYPFKHFDVSWSPGVSGIYLIFRMLCQVYNRLEVEFLPPYFPSQEEIEKPELYAENVRQVMAKTLGVECTNHAFEDVALLLQVGKYAHEHVVTLTDVGEVMSLTDLRGADIDKLVRYFVKHDLNQDGQISIEEMQQLFPNDDPKLLVRLFALVDANGNGQIDFRELCMGLRALNSKTNSADELMKFAFRLYDQDNNGVIDAREFESMLRFNQLFYGAESFSSVEKALSDVGVSSSTTDGNNNITFEVFQHLMRSQPDLLGHARSKLEVLRGSLRE
ncbi:Lysophosphatidylcholine acyltransferase [Globisporangium polare]